MKLTKLLKSRRKNYNQILISIQSTRLTFYQQKTAALCHNHSAAAYQLYIISLVKNLQTCRHHTAGNEQQFGEQTIRR